MVHVIHADAVTKTFNVGKQALTAVDDVTFAVEPGEFVSIIGPSGCGKSTMLKLIADIYQPTSGQLSVNGRSPREARLGRELGMVFQDPALFPWRNVLDNVSLPLEIAGRLNEESRRQSVELLHLVGLGDFLEASPDQLSGGMRQRVAIARALVLEPRLFLLDEPFGALDEITRKRMNLELLRIWTQAHTSALLITHSLSEAVFLSDRVLVMSPRPGTITDDVRIDLPRPRQIEMYREQRFFALETRISDALHLTAGSPEVTYGR
ncbi:ABC transporter ATP-binding protein [Actinopolymorpha sp. B11F2]|uniref:ABC transporter ATP-binding protein n=1 Tax=Actinopolymorpha sp. B11F2 TaxID=3160862 RepID=UPI0032E4D8C1